MNITTVYFKLILKNFVCLLVKFMLNSKTSDNGKNTKLKSEFSKNEQTKTSLK